MEMLKGYAWPGNVRELENMIERALILARGPEITAADLDFGRRGPAPSLAASLSMASMAAAAPMAPMPQMAAPTQMAPAPPTSAMNPPVTQSLVPAAVSGRSMQHRLHDQERSEIISAIEQSEGNIAAAARILGINRSTLYYRLRKHGLLHLMPTRLDPEEE